MTSFTEYWQRAIISLKSRGQFPEAIEFFYCFFSVSYFSFKSCYQINKYLRIHQLCYVFKKIALDIWLIIYPHDSDYNKYLLRWKSSYPGNDKKSRSSMFFPLRITYYISSYGIFYTDIFHIVIMMERKNRHC